MPTFHLVLTIPDPPAYYSHDRAYYLVEAKSENDARSVAIQDHRRLHGSRMNPGDRVACRVIDTTEIPEGEWLHVFGRTYEFSYDGRGSYDEPNLYDEWGRLLHLRDTSDFLPYPGEKCTWSLRIPPGEYWEFIHGDDDLIGVGRTVALRHFAVSGDGTRVEMQGCSFASDESLGHIAASSHEAHCPPWLQRAITSYLHVNLQPA